MKKGQIEQLGVAVGGGPGQGEPLFAHLQ